MDIAISLSTPEGRRRLAEAMVPSVKEALLMRALQSKLLICHEYPKMTEGMLANLRIGRALNCLIHGLQYDGSRLDTMAAVLAVALDRRNRPLVNRLALVYQRSNLQSRARARGIVRDVIKSASRGTYPKRKINLMKRVWSRILR